jgi:DNA invertase Pin-like site-specific DNA recombinase
VTCWRAVACGSGINEDSNLSAAWVGYALLLRGPNPETSYAEFKIAEDKVLIFTDKASGAKHRRPGLDACVEQLRSGDVLLVWRLDRLGRSVRHLVTLIDQLHEKQIGFRSVCDGAIDTTTPSGELIFHVFSALAQFD